MPSVMGDFRTGKFWTIGGPLVSLVVIGINMYFTYEIIAGYDNIAAYVIVGILAILYTGKFHFFFLLSLCINPLSKLTGD